MQTETSGRKCRWLAFRSRRRSTASTRRSSSRSDTSIANQTPIEAVYVFPLDEGAAVCAFEAMVDGTLVVGEVHERDKAFESYDDAMEQEHGAFLLDEERPDVFQASIGNLPPGKEVTVKLTYVTELAVDEGRFRFVIPTTVSPRYAPAQDRGSEPADPTRALNPPLACGGPVRHEPLGPRRDARHDFSQSSRPHTRSR